LTQAEPARSLGERILGFVDGFFDVPVDHDDAVVEERAEWMVLAIFITAIFEVHSSSRSGVFIAGEYIVPPYHLFMGCAFALWLWGRRTLGYALALGIAVFVHLRDLPRAPNHGWLEVSLFLVLLLVGIETHRNRRAVLGACRWMALTAIFASAFQKLAYGGYTNGAYLAYLMANSPKTTWLLSWMTTPAELERLIALGTEPGDGPYLIRSPLWVAMSNAVWILELVLPVAVIVRVTRRWAVPVILAVFGFIAVLSQELVFSSFMMAVLIPMLPRIPGRSYHVVQTFVLSLYVFWRMFRDTVLPPPPI